MPSIFPRASKTPPRVEEERASCVLLFSRASEAECNTVPAQRQNYLKGLVELWHIVQCWPSRIPSLAILQSSKDGVMSAHGILTGCDQQQSERRGFLRPVECIFSREHDGHRANGVTGRC